jgi:uncharacterized protein (TIGR02588 family)
MAPRKKPASAPRATARTPVAEWVAAALGLLLTLGVIGYLVREGLTERDGPPALSAVAQPATASAGGYALPVVIRNDSDATAADVEVLGTLRRQGQIIEERRTRFAYVPARGEARGGLVFQHDPAESELSVVPEGYEEP